MATPSIHMGNPTRLAADTPFSALCAMFDLTANSIAAAWRQRGSQFCGTVTEDDRARESADYWLTRGGSPWAQRPALWSEQDGTVTGVAGIPREGWIAVEEVEFDALVNTLLVYTPEALTWPTEQASSWMAPPMTSFSARNGDKPPARVGPGLRVQHTQDSLSCWHAFLRVLAGRITAEDALLAYRHIRAAMGVWNAQGGY